MAGKTAPLGICDLCGATLPDPYTSKGAPRRFCSRECRNTANSRAGAQVRGEQTRQRIAAGEWQNPMHLRPPTPEEQAARARKGRLQEVAAGTWRNPGLTEAARAQNSEPHLHSGPLAEAIELLKRGTMADLTPAQADAYRAYSRERQRARWERMSDEQRAQRREQWRASKRRHYTPKPKSE